MGTRSLTDVVDEQGKTLVTIYRQFDGYPEGHGAELRAITDGARLCNGFSGQSTPEWFNGIPCFAAWLIGKLKGDAIGGFYLMPPGSRDHGEEYVYTIKRKGKTDRLSVSCVDSGGKRKTIPKADANS